MSKIPELLVVSGEFKQDITRIYELVGALEAAEPELRALLAERDALRKRELKYQAQITEQKAEIKLLEEFFTHSPYCQFWKSDFDEEGYLEEGGTEYACNCQRDTNAERIEILRTELRSILNPTGER